MQRLILAHLSKVYTRLKAACKPYECCATDTETAENGVPVAGTAVNDYLRDGEISWQGIYYYFNKWSADGSWKAAWVSLLGVKPQRHRPSSVQLRGSHTQAKNVAAAVGYQGRKSFKWLAVANSKPGIETTNSLFLSDNAGQMLAVATA